MKKICLRVVFVILIVGAVLGAAYPAFAQTNSKESIVAMATEIADAVLSARMAADGADDLQHWAETVLPDMIGVGGEWYALALRQREPDLDLSAYSTALQTFLRDRAADADSAVTQQRYALALLASGGGDAYLARTAAQTVGAMGHMSYVYGLHLAHNGLQTSLTVEQMLSYLLQAQLPDGGWSVSGDRTKGSDVDVTAMTLQALADHREDERVAAAAESAWHFLSQA